MLTFCTALTVQHLFLAGNLSHLIPAQQDHQIITTHVNLTRSKPYAKTLLNLCLILDRLCSDPQPLSAMQKCSYL